MLMVTPILKVPHEQWVRGFWLVMVTSVTLLCCMPTYTLTMLALSDFVRVSVVSFY